MRRILIAGFAGSMLALAPALTLTAHASAGTACRTGDSLLYVGPTSQMGYLATKYDHNGDDFICVNGGSHGRPYYDNHFQ
jgi:hypothetical protein